MNDIPDPPAPESDRWPVRVWPGVVILALVAVGMTVPGRVAPRSLFHFYTLFLAPVLGSVAAVAWWAVAARASGRDRWLFPVLFLVPGVLLGVTIFQKKAMVVPIYGLPVVLALWVGWLVLSVGLARESRRVGLILALVGGWAALAQLRLNGTDVELVPELRWWWQKTAEELADAERAGRPKGTATGGVAVDPADWPGFRGANRDGKRTGVRVNPDWAASPPEQVWKHRIGPGWGSFAVVGNRLFTQEQRGADEAVVCLSADTGLEVWSFKQSGRFEEAIAGAGPRATPTVHDGKVFAQSATGKLACLDAATGSLVWSADLVADAGGVVPQWGYAGSPLVADGVVVVYTGAPNGKGTAAFNAADGKLAWAAGKAAHGYSSAHLARLGGVPQVLMVSDFGIESFDTAGKVLWEHGWFVKGVNRATQPTVLSDTDILVGTGVGPEQGTRRLRVTKAGEGWDVKTVWTSRATKPYFNDAVAHAGHLYGFDDNRLCCVDLETGKERWKDARYGHGQVVLLADQGLLLVQAVDGKVALVEANPDEFAEVAKFPALEKKTWNHPAVARDRLFVRNGEWAACYRLK